MCALYGMHAGGATKIIRRLCDQAVTARCLVSARLTSCHHVGIAGLQIECSTALEFVCDAQASPFCTSMAGAELAVAEPELQELLPYQDYLGRTPSYDRLEEVLDTGSGVPELHVEYLEHGWYVYRRFGNGYVCTETSPSGEERELADSRSQFIRFRDEEQCTVLPNAVTRWLFHNECLVYQLVVQRCRYYSMAGQVVSTVERAGGPPSFRWEDTHGTHWRARALSERDSRGGWLIRFDAYEWRSTPQARGRYGQLVYSRDRRRWLLGRDGDVVPRRIAMRLSNAIGFPTSDGFRSLSSGPPGTPSQ